MDNRSGSDRSPVQSNIGATETVKPATSIDALTNDDMTTITGSDGQRRKVVRTIRRRKGVPSDPGTVVSERVAMPPPPRRLSPRAVHSAASRELSPRANEAAPLVPSRSDRRAKRINPEVQRVADPEAGTSRATPLLPSRPLSNRDMYTKSAPPRRLSPRAQEAATVRALTPRVGAGGAPAIPPRAPRVPQVPSESQLEQGVFVDDNGNEVHAALTPRMMEDGTTRWVLEHENAPNTPRLVVGAPPPHLSHRAQGYMSCKRQAIEEEAQQRNELEKSATSERIYAFPPESLYEKQKRADVSEEWSTHCYDSYKSCKRLIKKLSEPDQGVDGTEQLVRTLQPIQLSKTSYCNCITAAHCDDAAGKELLGDQRYAENCKKYLNLQPVPLARADIPELADFLSPLSARDDVDKPERRNTSRGLATLGGIWCTVDGIREDGRPVTARDVKPPRRVMRVCGGQVIGQPMKLEGGRSLGVRCYELLLFPQESISPDAVNYGAEGITLGHVVPPPASSFPLTPRLVDDPVTLREWRKKLLMKDRQAVLANNRDDNLTFRRDAADQTEEKMDDDDGKTFVTLTIVSVSQRQKFTVDLTLVLLPYMLSIADQDRFVVEVPRFCPDTAVKHRRIQGVSLSFSTRDAFMSAYKTLLWATECNITDVVFLNSSNPADKGYARLRMGVTASPLSPWVSAMDIAAENSESGRGAFQRKCLDFTALNLLNARNKGAYDPLRLEDFVVEEKKGEITLKKSTIFTDTLDVGKPEDSNFVDKNATVVAFIPFGVIRRAVSQKTRDVFDVRVVPRNKVQLLPLSTQSTKGRKIDEIEMTQVDRDVEAAIIMEYISRLPSLSPVYGVILDEHRYYIFQEPWVSALSMEKQHRSSPGRVPSMQHNEQLKAIAENTVMMTLKDFMHAILHPHNSQSEAQGHHAFDKMEAKLQLMQLLCSELLLLLVAVHGKGLLLGPCPPQRILVRIETSLKDDEVDAGDSPNSGHSITSRHIQLFVPDLGINSKSWAYERQQCGVLEYLSPFYILDTIQNHSHVGVNTSWTVYDDWWTFLCLTFELMAFDGSSLIKPHTSPAVPLPTPLISEFYSPSDILGAWRHILASDSSSGISSDIREFVHKRVLSSVSPELDSWIASKAEELEFFGTTGPRKKGKEGLGCITSPSEGQSFYIGVSLSSMYLNRGRSVSQSPREPGEPPAAHAENVLEEVPFVMHYRELFDAVLDIVLPKTRKGCGVHTPSLYLLSHPFFRNVKLGDIFDGSWQLPRAAQAFFFRQMRKSKAEQAVAAYRREAFQSPLTRRPEAPLLLAGSSSGAPGGPFLLLSAGGQGDVPPSVSDGDGLMVTPARYRDPSENRAGKPANRLYTKEEQGEIEQCENQVRNALHNCVSKDPRSQPRKRDAPRRREPIESTHSRPVYTSEGPARNEEEVCRHPAGRKDSLNDPVHVRRNNPKFDNEFQCIENELNQMAAPSQTSTSMNSIRNSVWPNEFVESSVQRSRAASFIADIPQDNREVIYAPEPKPYGHAPYSEVLVPSDND